MPQEERSVLATYDSKQKEATERTKSLKEQYISKDTWNFKEAELTPKEENSADMTHGKGQASENAGSQQNI